MIKLFLLSTLVVWLLYIWVMTLDRWTRRQQGIRRYAGYILTVPALIVGYPLDVLYNWTWGSLLFWETPPKWNEPLTRRLQRYIKFRSLSSNRLDRYRYLVARAICKYLLHPFDPLHCGAKL